MKRCVIGQGAFKASSDSAWMCCWGSQQLERAITCSGVRQSVVEKRVLNIKWSREAEVCVWRKPSRFNTSSLAIPLHGCDIMKECCWRRLLLLILPRPGYSLSTSETMTYLPLRPKAKSWSVGFEIGWAFKRDCYLILIGAWARQSERRPTVLKSLWLFFFLLLFFKCTDCSKSLFVYIFLHTILRCFLHIFDILY